MSVISRIVFVLLLHLAFFVCFPDTGMFGAVFGWISCIFCISFVFLLQNTMKAAYRSGHFIGFIADLLLFAFFALAISLFMPQKSRMSPFEKIRAGRLPTTGDMQRGLRKFGINVSLVKPSAEIEVKPAESAQKNGK